ncbi:hypothetical protein [Planctomycetes bacterium K23_9]|uniref:Bacterial type II and III secretion system protein n=1 Tax=Stieleria marina TaxID=1930275 RepID=A0A517NWN7_9BACT|nr:hypothetical protein K239x_35270 [Planctomycetes bacterium K23_9]
MHAIRNARCFFPALALLALCVCGCATWTDRTTGILEAATTGKTGHGESPLSKLKENSKNIVLNVEFVPIKVDETSLDEIQSIWQWTDETVVDPGLRRELSLNGIRAGRVIRRDRLIQRLDQMRSTDGVLDQFLSQADIASEVSHGGQRIPMRVGRRYELPVRQPIEGTHVSMVRLDGELFGRTLQDPQFLFAVKATTGNTTREINLQLRPEIQHGSMRQRWISSDTALRINTRRETWSLESLDLNLTGVEGDTFFIGGTTPRVGLGKQMLSGHRSDNSQHQVVMLITFDQIPTAAEQL